MSVRITNTTKAPFTLSGFCDIGPGESIDAPYEKAILYAKTPGLRFDYSGGALPFKTNGKVSHVTLNSPLHPTGGYGVIGLNAIAGFLARGVDVSLACPLPSWLRDQMYTYRPELIPTIWRPDPFISEVGLGHTTPSEFADIPSPRKIGWTMWEATRMPREWVKLCKLCEHLIVPSSGQIPIFEEAGVPITVVPDGMGVEDFTFKADRDPDPEHFTFISWSRMSSRKCPLETVQCFSAAFPRQKFPKVRLVMKTMDGMFGGGEVGIPTISDDRVTIVNERWPQRKLVEFCHNAHAAVFLSHGEGFYNPPTQAMATGLPVVLPTHSGCADQCDERYNYPVGLSPTEPYESSRLVPDEDLQWWVMDYDVAVERMREIYRDRDEAYAKGRSAAAWVRQKFSIDVMVDGLLGVLQSA